MATSAVAWIDTADLSSFDVLLAPVHETYAGQMSQVWPSDGWHLDTTPESLTAGSDVDTMEVIAAWHAWLASSYAPATFETYTKAVALFFQHHPVMVGAITEDVLVQWLERYPFRSSARRTYYQAMRSFLKFAERRGMIEGDPSSFLRVPAVVEKVPRALSLEEVTRLAIAGAARHPKRGLVILLLYYTGARLTEAVNLRWTDVSSEGLLIRQGKGGKQRLVRMHPHLGETLEHLRDFSDGPFIIGRSGGTVWGWVKQAGLDAGIPHCHPHLMRSSMATAMLRRGGRPHAVKAVLGHESLRTTQRYWAVEVEDEEQALALL